MNHRERRISFYLLLLQGVYYVVLGFILLSFQFLSILYLFEETSRTAYLSALAPAIFILIGATLFLAKNVSRQTTSTAVLGAGTSFAFLLHHSFFLYHFEVGRVLWWDLLIQTAFLLGWIWLLYWQWIERKFKNL